MAGFTGFKRTLAAIALAALFLFVPAAALAQEYEYDHVPAPGMEMSQFFGTSRTWESDMLTNRYLTRRLERVNIHGPIPVVSAAFGQEADTLNEKIEAAATDMISEASRARARSITFSYDVYTTHAVVSIVIFGDITTSISRTLVRSVNFCVESGAQLEINRAMGGLDVLSLAMRMLNERIRMFPERYYAALSATFDDQAFFIDYNHLVLLFDEFRLSTRATGVNYIALELSNVRTYALSPRYYHTTADGYELMMIPIRRVAGGLGYNVIWDERTEVVRVLRGDTTIIEFTPGINSFTAGGTTRSLETAPVRIGDEGLVYVPITFFDQLLPLTTYSIADCGTITFVAYLEPMANATLPSQWPLLDFEISGIFLFA